MNECNWSADHYIFILINSRSKIVCFEYGCAENFTFIVNTYPSPMIVEYIDLSELVEILPVSPVSEKGNQFDVN